VKSGSPARVAVIANAVFWATGRIGPVPVTIDQLV